MFELKEIELSKDQDKAFKEIKDWLSTEDNRFKTLEENQFKTLGGYAGTGKTTLLNFVVNHAVKKGMNTAVTATTNKAVKVLREKVELGSFMTIHSLLNIKPKKKKDKEVFEPVFNGMNNISRYDLVIVDECSMISEKLIGVIQEQIDTNLKVLFCGDPAQLQPINEEKSKCFDFNPSILKTIVRYGDTIAQKAKLVRETSKEIPVNKLLDPPTIREATPKEVFEYFNSFRENPDNIRLLCWTNARVDKWNKRLRKADYGEEVEELFVPGDIVIANEPCMKDDNIIMMNSEEGIVTHTRERSDSWELDVDLINGAHAHVRVCKPEYRSKLRSKLTKLSRNKEWKEFWALKKSFHDVKHCYAMTTHKSQGSTFQNVVIDTQDINKNFDIENRNQLLYVAMTRAAQEVMMIL